MYKQSILQDQTMHYSSWQAREIYLDTRKFHSSLQGILVLNDINEQDTSFPDCKHKHVMKNGAPPDRFGVLHCL